MMNLMLRNDTRIAFIDTGAYELDCHRANAKENAARFGLRFEEIKASPSLVEKLLFDLWDEECVVVEWGGTVRYQVLHLIGVDDTWFEDPGGTLPWGDEPPADAPALDRGEIRFNDRGVQAECQDDMVHADDDPLQ